MMKILVLTQAYPTPEGDVSLTYVRTRNVFYKSQGAHVDIINFNTNDEYKMDGLNVYPLEWFNKEYASFYDLLICHAPNLRSHYKFLKKYGYLFPKKVFFFHGHEVLKKTKVYPKPYYYVKKNIFRNLIQDVYDDLKLRIWRTYFKKNHDSCHLVYVSNWMRNEFYKWVRINPFILEGHEYITYNSVGETFEKNSFQLKAQKKYDFVTIRSVLDGSKYAIDIVNNLALNNPAYKFLIIGKGDFFKYYKKAPNITWIDKQINHQEMLEFLNESNCALMPTRTDAQGVMMCEMAAFGIPVITSDIPVCHEVFDKLETVCYIDNNKKGNESIKDIYKSIRGLSKKHTRYYFSKVTLEEFHILQKILNG